MQGHTWCKSYTMYGYEALAKRQGAGSGGKQLTEGKKQPAFWEMDVAVVTFHRCPSIANGLEE